MGQELKDIGRIIDEVKHRREVQKSYMKFQEILKLEREKEIENTLREKARADREKARADEKEALLNEEKARADREKARADEKEALLDEEKAHSDREKARADHEHKRVEELEQLLIELQKKVAEIEKQA